MASAALTNCRAWTDQELEDLPVDGHKYELLNGRLIGGPVPANHGAICVRLILLIGAFVQRRKLGELYDSSTGFRISESILLSPDVSFVSKASLKKVFRGPDKFLRGAPDLAIESYRRATGPNYCTRSSIFILSMERAWFGWSIGNSSRSIFIDRTASQP